MRIVFVVTAVNARLSTRRSLRKSEHIRIAGGWLLRRINPHHRIPCNPHMRVYPSAIVSTGSLPSCRCRSDRMPERKMNAHRSCVDATRGVWEVSVGVRRRLHTGDGDVDRHLTSALCYSWAPLK